MNRNAFPLTAGFVVGAILVGVVISRENRAEVRQLRRELRMAAYEAETARIVRAQAEARAGAAQVELDAARRQLVRERYPGRGETEFAELRGE